MLKKKRITPTHPITNKLKHDAKIKRLDALGWLAQTFPEAFDNRVRIRPLKVGIMQDVLAHEKTATSGFSKTKIREAVVLFARRVDYLVCLKAQEKRVDLFGNTVGEVTETEAIKAKNKIKKRIEKAVKHVHQQNASYRQTTAHSPVRQRPSITIKSRSRVIKKLEEELSLTE